MSTNLSREVFFRRIQRFVINDVSGSLLLTFTCNKVFYDIISRLTRSPFVIFAGIMIERMVVIYCLVYLFDVIVNLGLSHDTLTSLLLVFVKVFDSEFFIDCRLDAGLLGSWLPWSL